MAKIPYTLGNKQFPTKLAAREYIAGIRKAAHGPGPITDPEAVAVLRDLLRLHPRHDLYETMGIKGFAIVPVPAYADLGFGVVLANGWTDLFSYRVCLGMKPLRSKVLSALRTAVAPQTQAWKHDHYPIKCAISGVDLAWEDYHVDHAPPWEFKNIVAAFFNDEAELLSVELVDAPSGVGQVLADSDLERRWAAFHEERAQYRALHWRENLRREE